MTIEKIISGGQTGADRAALDWAIGHGIPHGGWCPHGRKAEDGILDLRYKLIETPLENYAQRTEWNVRDSDGTAIFSVEESLVGGSLLTKIFARKYHRPFLHLYKKMAAGDRRLKFCDFLQKNNINDLNVAGSRALESPEIYSFVLDFLNGVFSEKR